MANSLIDSMTSKWHPEKYKDDYRDGRRSDRRQTEAGGNEIEEKPRKAPKPTKVRPGFVIAAELRAHWREERRRLPNRAGKQPQRAQESSVRRIASPKTMANVIAEPDLVGIPHSS